MVKHGLFPVLGGFCEFCPQVPRGDGLVVVQYTVAQYGREGETIGVKWEVSPAPLPQCFLLWAAQPPAHM